MTNVGWRCLQNSSESRHGYRKCQGDQHDEKLHNTGETGGYVHYSIMLGDAAENKVSLGYSRTQKYPNHLCRTKVQMQKLGVTLRRFRALGRVNQRSP